jgi:hypothetical protein
MPDNPQAQQGTPPPDLMQLITTLLAGAGFKSVAKGVSDLGNSGVNPMGMMQDPNLKMFMAGAGIRDTANSMNLVQPIMKMLQPPPPPPQPNPQEMAASMQMLSSKLGPGMSGLRPPMGPTAMGIPPPGGQVG